MSNCVGPGVHLQAADAEHRLSLSGQTVAQACQSLLDLLLQSHLAYWQAGSAPAACHEPAAAWPGWLGGWKRSPVVEGSWAELDCVTDAAVVAHCPDEKQLVTWKHCLCRLLRQLHAIEPSLMWIILRQHVARAEAKNANGCTC